MDTSIVLTRGAEQNGLAREVRRRLLLNLAHPSRLLSFRKMWGTLVLVCREESPAAQSLGLSGAGTLTLRFDYGTLTIHEGRVGRPDVTIWGSAREILALNGWRVWVPGRVQGLALALFRTSRSTVGPEVFGRATHLRLLYRFARLLDGRE